MKIIPYKINDYKTLIEENYLYIDKTMYIEKLENNNDTLIYLRPKGFGKTLFISMLYYYYDINCKEYFNDLFKDTYIYKHITNKKNSYYILKFNFSNIDSNINKKNIETLFNDSVVISIQNFKKKYNIDITIDYDKQASVIIDRLFANLDGNISIYILIDEYDSFIGKNSKEDYGFIKDFYAIIKKWSGSIVKKTFITGVSSINLDSMTSGFNIATNITNNPNYNTMTGLTHEELKKLLSYFNIQDNIVDKIFDDYKFSIYAKENILNTNQVMYCLHSYLQNNKIPKKPIYIDNNQIKNILRLFNKSIIEKVINTLLEDKKIISNLEENFYLQGHENDDDYLVSLLYYFGYLKIKCRLENTNYIVFTFINKEVEKYFQIVSTSNLI